MVIPIWSAIGVFILVLLGEALHARRIRKLGALAFGPVGRPRPWTQTLMVLRPAAAAALAFGLTALVWEVEPRVLNEEEDAVRPGEERHLVLCLDVSPSMRLQDAGPEKEQSRLHRARDVLDSLFSRIAVKRYGITVVATYNGAKPVVIDSKDSEVVRNILSDLPMHIAFKPGPTRLLRGIAKAGEIAKDWRRNSTLLVMISDGDTVPPTGMPDLPPSIDGVLIAGVGDPITGSFIDGHQSRQDSAALRQIAMRLRGEFHDCNTKLIPTHMLESLTGAGDAPPQDRFGLREYALLAAGLGALLLALIPILLQRAGGAWGAGHVPGRSVLPGRSDSIREVRPNPAVRTGSSGGAAVSTAGANR